MDIIEAPQNDRNIDRFGMPIMDVGPQSRGMRHDGREVQRNSNFSAEERQVQRTLALLRGMRLNENESIARRMNRQGFNPFGAMPERIRNEMEQQDGRNTKTSTLSELTSVFAPMNNKEVIDKLQSVKTAKNASLKLTHPWLSDFNKQTEQNITRFIRDQRDPRNQYLSRSRSQLIEQIDARILDAELGLGRPFGFIGAPGIREDDDSLLARYDRMLQERARLWNVQENLPQDRFGGGFAPAFGNEQEAEDLGVNRMNENYRALEVPARNHHLQIL
jgi:hypothetical protein